MSRSLIFGSVLAGLAALVLPPLTALATPPPMVSVGGIERFEDGVAGSQPAMTGVDALRGTWSTGVTLEALPARGPAPDLTLRWAAPGTDSLTGAGFRWSFDRRITRESASGGAPRLDDQDVFRSGGRALVELGDGTWRLEDDPWTVFERTDDGWITRRDGHEQTFAAVEEPCTPASCPPARRWHLVEETDSFGHSMDIVWEVPAWDGSSTDLARPAHISYQGGAHIITFEWEERPDVRRRVEAGALRTLAHRLAAVRVEAVRDDATHLAAYYTLSYRDDLTADGRSLLERLEQVEVVGIDDLGDQVLPIARFDYAEDEDLSFAHWAPLVFQGADPVPADYDFGPDVETSYTTLSRLADVDGDALPDLVQLNSACSAGGDSPNWSGEM